MIICNNNNNNNNQGDGRGVTSRVTRSDGTKGGEEGKGEGDEGGGGEEGEEGKLVRTGGRDDIEGSTRGPPGPKKKLYITVTIEACWMVLLGKLR